MFLSLHHKNRSLNRNGVYTLFKFISQPTHRKELHVLGIKDSDVDYFISKANFENSSSIQKSISIKSKLSKIREEVIN
jgi:hypothetical protein